MYSNITHARSVYIFFLYFLFFLSAESVGYKWVGFLVRRIAWATSGKIKKNISEIQQQKKLKLYTRQRNWYNEDSQSFK